MREDRELCTHFRYHKHKIIFFLAAMRSYAAELRAAGIRVHYEALGESDEPFETRLVKFLTRSVGTRTCPKVTQAPIPTFHQTKSTSAPI